MPESPLIKPPQKPDLTHDLLRCKSAAWSLAVLTAALAVVAWGQTFRWQLGSLNVYELFPLLGLLAFSLMWSQYIAGVVRKSMRLSPQVLTDFFAGTGWLVLLLIFLHPGLLVFQRFRDGYGLPPGSYMSYVRPGLGWVTLLGTVSFLIFLAFELRRVFGKHRWWRFMTYATDAAVLLVYYHGLRLGDQLQAGWFRYVWYVYGVSLVGVFLYNYSTKYRAQKTEPA